MEDLSRIRKKNLRWLLLVPIIVILDQVTKYYAVQSLTLYSPVPIMPYLNLTLAHNAGAAFSFLSRSGGWQRWFFIGLAIVISVGIVVWIYRQTEARTRCVIGATLILAGAIGNVWDRMVLGYVIDFIDFYVNSWHWPAFNIADIAISTGAGLLILDMIVQSFKERRSE